MHRWTESCNFSYSHAHCFKPMVRPEVFPHFSPCEYYSPPPFWRLHRASYLSTLQVGRHVGVLGYFHGVFPMCLIFALNIINVTVNLGISSRSLSFYPLFPLGLWRNRTHYEPVALTNWAKDPITGDNLLSHRASPAVSWALLGLTVVFGMGTGVALKDIDTR